MEKRVILHPFHNTNLTISYTKNDCLNGYLSMLEKTTSNILNIRPGINFHSSTIPILRDCSGVRQNSIISKSPDIAVKNPSLLAQFPTYSYLFDMRWIAVLFIICVSYSYNYGQKVTISDPIALGYNTRYRLMDKMGENIAVFIDKNTSYELHLYDNNLKKIRDRSIFQARGTTLMSGVYVNNTSLELFYSFGIKDSTYLVHRTYDERARAIDSTMVMVRADRNYNNPFLFTYSEDKSKALFFKPGIKNHLHAVVYDVNERVLLWEKEFYFDRKIDKEFQFVDISNEGTVYLVLDKNNTRIKSGEHLLKIYEYSGYGEIKLHNISFDDKLTFRLTGKYDNLNRTLFIAGFYADNTFTQANGIFLFRLSGREDKFTSLFEPFDYKTLQDIENQRKRKIEGVTDLEISELLLTDNGGIVILGEVRREYFTRMNYSSRFSPGMNSNIDYYSEDILAMAISPQDEVEWTRVIHKRQFSQDDNAIYSSFFIFIVPSFIELVFNDEISSNSTVSAFGINGAGDVNRINLMSTGLQDLRIRFRRAVQTSSNSFLAPSDFKGELKLVLVEF